MSPSCAYTCPTASLTPGQPVFIISVFSSTDFTLLGRVSPSRKAPGLSPFRGGRTCSCKTALSEDKKLKLKISPIILEAKLHPRTKAGTRHPAQLLLQHRRISFIVAPEMPAERSSLQVREQTSRLSPHIRELGPCHHSCLLSSSRF
ncbi:hypothetical protein CB1_000849038 [Camelus ferus]|nr:hypothetical protein CB1_000849038 [Camelus ferus]